MSDDDLENDDLEVGDEDETEEGLETSADDVADDDGGDDAPAPAAKGKSKAAVSVDDLPSVEAKNKERDALARAMEEFLSKGGKVQEVEANVVADPPKKPDNKYGSRPIKGLVLDLKKKPAVAAGFFVGGIRASSAATKRVTTRRVISVSTRPATRSSSRSRHPAPCRPPNACHPG